MFHWQGGWYFEGIHGGGMDSVTGLPTDFQPERLGMVHIVLRETAHADSPIVAEAFVPAAEWASIIASVSVQGETSHTWPLAVAFHMGGQPLPPSR